LQSSRFIEHERVKTGKYMPQGSGGAGSERGGLKAVPVAQEKSSTLFLGMHVCMSVPDV
jgi:hypothetical protein